MATTAMSPTAKARIAVFKQMSPATQTVAQELEAKLGTAVNKAVLTQYDLGSRVKDILGDEPTYGQNAVKQLADYLAISGGENTLYAMMSFAETFDRDFVKENGSRALANGEFLNVSHWIALAKIEDAKTRKAMLERVVAESMSASVLAVEIRGGAAKTKHARQGGRKPATPASATAGLQRTFEIANKFTNWEDVVVKSVIPALEGMDSEKVNKELLTLCQKTLDKVTAAKKNAGKIETQLQSGIERLERVLAKKKEKKGEEKAEPKKAAPASKNGATAKKKAGKPVAA